MHYPPEVLPTVRKLANEHEPAGDWMTVAQLAELVNKSPFWIRKQVDKLVPDSGESRVAGNGQQYKFFSPRALVLLREEAKKIVEAGEWMTVNEISERVGKSYNWVRSRLVERFCGTDEVRLDRKTNRPCPHFSKTVVLEIERVAKVHPDADGWYNKEQIINALPGRSDGWVEKRLPLYEALVEVRCADSGRAVCHYPPSVLADFFRQAEEFERVNKSDDWMTIEAMGRELKRSPQWVASQIRDHFPDNTGEIRRLASDNNLHLCYPPCVFRKIADASVEHPEAGDWVTLGQISKEVRKNRGWVCRKIEELFGTVSEMRRDSTNRVCKHYPPVVISRLLDEVDKFKKAEGWLTIPGIAKLISRESQWVRARVSRFNDVREMQRDHRNVPCWHYPLHVLEELRRIN